MQTRFWEVSHCNEEPCALDFQHVRLTLGVSAKSALLGVSWLRGAAIPQSGAGVVRKFGRKWARTAQI